MCYGLIRVSIKIGPMVSGNIILIMCTACIHSDHVHNTHSYKHAYTVGFPLTILGGIMGKNLAGNFDAPCRTKNIAREIPPAPWYRSLLVHMAIGGFLPFRYGHYI